LQKLEIHFNSIRIVEDLENISKDPRLQGLRSLPRCTLSCINVYRMPLTVDEPGCQTVANGMIDIFPSLERCGGLGRAWEMLYGRIVELRRVQWSRRALDERSIRLPLHPIHS
jgi:hypothetical protein